MPALCMGVTRGVPAGQKSGVVHALGPDRDGAVLWQRRVGEGGPIGGVQWGSENRMQVHRRIFSHPPPSQDFITLGLWWERASPRRP